MKCNVHAVSITVFRVGVLEDMALASRPANSVLGLGLDLEGQVLGL